MKLRYLCNKRMEKDQQIHTQQKMVKDSLERAFDELHAGEVRKDARSLFISA